MANTYGRHRAKSTQICQTGPTYGGHRRNRAESRLPGTCLNDVPTALAQHLCNFRAHLGGVTFRDASRASFRQPSCLLVLPASVGRSSRRRNKGWPRGGRQDTNRPILMSLLTTSAALSALARGLTPRGRSALGPSEPAPSLRDFTASGQNPCKRRSVLYENSYLRARTLARIRAVCIARRDGADRHGPLGVSGGGCSGRPL